MKAYLQVFQMEIRRILAYRVDFWINFVGQTFFKLLLSYFLWVNIFATTGKSQIGGYDLNKLILYYVVVSVLFKLQNGGTIGHIANEIYKGGLTKFILYPINFFLYKTVTFLANTSFYFIQLIVVLLIYHFLIDDISFLQKPSLFPFFILSVYLSALCYFFMTSICELIAFWADQIWSLSVMLRFFVSFLGGVMVPLSFFPDWSVKLLYYTPFPYLIDLPMNIFWQKLSTLEMLKGMGIQVLWISVGYGLCLLLWKKGRYKYTGVGI